MGSYHSEGYDNLPIIPTVAKCMWLLTKSVVPIRKKKKH